MCELGTRWDQQLPEAMLKKWNKWSNNLPEKIVVPRAFRLQHEKIEAIDFHVFSDASIIETVVVLYAIIYHSSGTSQGLVAAKSRLSKRNLTIPKLELVAMHTAANLCKNIRDSLEEQPIRTFYGWTGSSVTLHWTRGRGTYKQFVSNKFNKIHEKDFINWRHIPADRNPADIGSRGSSVDKIHTDWWNGPSWLQCQHNWPPDINTEPTVETENKVKKIQEILRVSVESNHQNDEILEKVFIMESFENQMLH